MLQRGVGEGAVGSSLSLVSPMEDKSHSKIVEALQVAFSKFFLDGRLMSSAQARTNLASKIVVASELEQKAKSRKNWFLENAKEAEMEIDTDLLEEDRPEKESIQLREAKQAKNQLAKLLAEPMHTQRYGKFLSTNSAAFQSGVQQVIVPLAGKKKKKKKRKVKK